MKNVIEAARAETKALLLASLINDLYGRLPVFYASWGLRVVGGIITISSNEYWWIITGIVMQNMGDCSNAMVVPLYTNEIIGKLIRQ